MNGPTGLVLLNLGGPADLDAIRPFLDALFADREIIRLPGGALGQKLIARMIVRARLPKVRANYAAIGGGSPILRFTTGQGEGVVQRLARRRPDLGPVKPYIAFRYAPPTADDALRAMHADGVRRAVVLTLYPQYSEATTGSSLRDLQRALGRTGLEGAFDFTIVDRWSAQPSYLDVLAAHVEEGLCHWPEERRSGVVVLMSAHSLPMSFVDDGDPVSRRDRADLPRHRRAAARAPAALHARLPEPDRAGAMAGPADGGRSSASWVPRASARC